MTALDPADAPTLERREGETALAHLARLTALLHAAEVAVRQVGRVAHEGGASWSEVARAGGLGSPSTAYWKFHPGDDHRREALRQRQATRMRTAVGARPKHEPGVGVIEASKRLKVTPKTIYARVGRGELSSMTTADGRLRITAELPPLQ